MDCVARAQSPSHLLLWMSDGTPLAGSMYIVLRVWSRLWQPVTHCHLCRLILEALTLT